MSEWISVKERLPHDKEIVLGCRDNYVSDMWYDAGVFKSTADSRCYYSDVTHWMPLPEPPAPTLTVKEALREAIDRLERIVNCCREGNHHSKLLESAVDGMEALPRLRAALESEE